ncbi:activating transcription factor 3 [Daktulosphaira vitifoliae]|uniref:activating transcription factor 3 n=1 Tax=Daktulosphaira vitifoliae TaxID=58002 RepID=UPI0021AA253C|nr:activating transcription factor 3 [Daktulosphaira vitifoliae]XP_050538576.1 activating transcription factor 3 [Daktulosphaira vitifoliae]
MYSTSSNHQAISGVSGCSQIPRTPEVINSIISMMNPFDRFASSPVSEDSSSSSSPISPPRMQNICSSLLIKEELKMAIRQKQKNAVVQTAATSPVSSVSAGSSTGSLNSQVKKRRQDEESHGDDDDDVSSYGEGLTAEDEERRRRRRERNKIAATKCRLKKREKTVNLVQESESLETKNYDLKTQIQELETQRNKLMKMLTVHPCAKRHYQHEYTDHHAIVGSPNIVHGGEGGYDSYGHQQQAEPLVLKDAMFNPNSIGAHNNNVYTDQTPYHHHVLQYQGVATGYGGGCVDDVYGYKEGHDMAQYYDQGIC